MAKTQNKIALGLMSGTSCDGVDAALIETDGQTAMSFLGGLTVHYEESLRWRVLEAGQHDVPLSELLKVEQEITQHHVEAVRRHVAALRESSVLIAALMGWRWLDEGRGRTRTTAATVIVAGLVLLVVAV